ncbi:MAG: bifunctional phosphopantothenoylcysteine decarboxylase/phosphopantothenate--cysteine ligase CoaBC [bacterium]|nr:bifunctional phosphopantothenoylcysteine decarboxylase/phosphopantothenate--cysteine ligase CoaBC [bacterium]
MTTIDGRGRVVLGVSGGIAAYKAVDILRELQRHGVEVRVIMTGHAAEFVSPRTFAVLSDHEVEVDQWSRPTEPGVDHVALSHWADLLLIAPATANTLAKMAAGIADDALATYHLAHRRKILVAPAMNTVMWHHPATQDAMAKLQSRDVQVVPPATGELACGDEGEGRLAEVRDIVDHALRMLPPRGVLEGTKIVVSAGPTREPVDMVRVLSNRSSGRMGVAIAQTAADMGADVVLVHGPISVATPLGVTNVAVNTAEEMGVALDEHLGDADALFMAAAVADFRPSAPSDGKLDRRAGEAAIALEPVPDLAAGIGAREQRPYLVVFSAEAGADHERALAKMRAKGADAVVLNDVSAPGVGMEADANEVWVKTGLDFECHIPRAAKSEVARQIILGLSGEILSRRASQ